MIDEYTRLLEAVAETGSDKIAGEAVKKLVAHLKSTGKIKMLGGILRELRKIAGRRRALAPKVEVAHRGEGPAALRAAAKEGIRAEHAVINPTLIAGWRARGKGMLIDHSAKAALVSIYQNVTR